MLTERRVGLHRFDLDQPATTFRLCGEGDAVNILREGLGKSYISVTMASDETKGKHTSPFQHRTSPLAFVCGWDTTSLPLRCSTDEENSIDNVDPEAAFTRLLDSVPKLSGPAVLSDGISFTIGRT